MFNIDALPFALRCTHRHATGFTKLPQSIDLQEDKGSPGAGVKAVVSCPTWVLVSNADLPEQCEHTYPATVLATVT